MIAPLQPTRDSVTTIRPDGSRRFLFPADSPGRFRQARRLTAGLLIAAYLGLPWLRVGGYPAVFLDVANRRFHLFGTVLAAQDLWLLFFLISGLGFGLFFVTALLGRIWCGWACPQTVFLDHVFRRWERWIEGDAVRRRRRAAAPLTFGAIVRRGAKHGGYLIFAAAITHLWLAYFVSLPALWGMMRSAPGQNWSVFLFIGIATAAIYFNFAWFREQLCIVLCPYGRLQSALTDDHTLVIGYDPHRGEPRGRPQDPAAGACVDCLRCVSVCPVGIDIRQGLQLECIGCAACVDACDGVMDKLHRPRGLIRYDSLAGLAGRATRWVRPRTIVYAVLLLIGAGVATWGLSTLRPVTLSMVRMTGAPYFLDGNQVRDQFLVRIVNKRNEPAEFRFAAKGLPAGVTLQGADAPLRLAPLGEELRLLVLVESRRNFIRPFTFSIQASDAAHRTTVAGVAEFLGPENPP